MDCFNNSSLRGKRYRNLLRVSTTLNDASIPDQESANTKFADMHGMIHVGGDEVLEGVSGSKTFNRHDLKRLLATATLKKDYDVLLVYDSSRLTRGGAGHGYSIRRQFAKAGVLIQSVMDPVPDGDLKDVMQSIIDTQNNLYSKKLSAFITRGIVNAVLRGDVAHHGALPPGIDRVYIRADGTRFLRLKYVGNRVRELWNEENKSLLLRCERGSGTAYRKQKSEKVIIVPGDKNVVDAIRAAFEQRYIRGWGYGQIALELTRRGVVPLMGGVWEEGSVRSFLLNPLYLGWDYFLKTAAGLFHKGSADGPVRRDDVHQEQLEDEGFETLPKLFRKRAEMLRREQPEMNEFLIDSAVREKAELAMSRFFDEFHVRGERSQKGKQPKQLKSAWYARYPNSRYFLRGIMREPTLKRNFAGRVLGRKPRTRYYHLSHNHCFCEPGSPGRRNIPAEPLERAVLEIVQYVFQQTGNVDTLVSEHVKKVLAEKPVNIDRDRLHEELQEVRDRQRAIYMTANSKKLIEMKDLIKSLQSREDQIVHELSLIPIETIGEDAASITSRVMTALSRLHDQLDNRSACEKLHSLLRVLVKDFTMDLATREGLLVIELPEDILRLGNKPLEDVCAAFNEVNFRAGCTHNYRSVEIGVFRLIPPVSPSEDWPTEATFKWVEITESPINGHLPDAA